MDTKSQTKKTSADAMKKTGDMFGRFYAFNNTLKLYHWHVTGKGSYAQHIALDQALETLPDTLDRVVETTYAMYGDIQIIIPECRVPSNIVDYVSDFFDYIDDVREEVLPEDFSQSILDDYQEAIQQLLYRLKRLQ